MKTREERHIARSINKLKNRFNKMCDALCKRFDSSYDDVVTAIQLQSTCSSKDIALCNGDNTAFGRVDPETGEIRDILMYFEDCNDIVLTRRCLEAYLITNKEFLDECLTNDLKRLINEKYN